LNISDLLNIPTFPTRARSEAGAAHLLPRLSRTEPEHDYADEECKDMASENRQNTQKNGEN
jgi:hypothetical protein